VGGDEVLTSAGVVPGSATANAGNGTDAGTTGGEYVGVGATSAGRTGDATVVGTGLPTLVTAGAGPKLETVAAAPEAGEEEATETGAGGVVAAAVEPGRAISRDAVVMCARDGGRGEVAVGSEPRGRESSELDVDEGITDDDVSTPGPGV
jgi:hypothetical protein